MLFKTFMLKVGSMNCPNCGSAMSASKISWLCLDCGHIEQSTEAIPEETKSPAQPVSEPAAISSEPAAPQPEALPGPQELAADVQGNVSDGINPATPMTPSVAVPPVSATPSPTSSVSSVAPDLGQNRRKPLLIGGAALLAVLLVAATGLKLFWYDPQNAPMAYFSKVAAAKTGSFQANVNYKTDNKGNDLFGIGNNATLKASGAYDLADEKNPKTDIKLNFKASQFEIGGRLITMPKTLYFQLSDAGFLSMLGIKGGNEWYKFPLEKSKEDEKECVDPKNAKVNSYFGATIPAQIPVNKARRVGLYEKVAGHTTTHYTGTIDFNKLQKIVDTANKGMSADCKIELSKEDYKDLTISYDLWTSKSFDRIVLKMVSTGKDTKGTSIVTVDSSGYNKAVKIEAPKGAKDFSLFNDLEGSFNTEFESPEPVLN